MLKRRLCEARLEWRLQCEGPLLIADGRYDQSTLPKERGKYPDKVFISHAHPQTVRQAVEQAHTADALMNLGFYVPGTSLRGPFRAQAERIVRSLLPESMAPPRTACDPFEDDDKPLQSCSKRFDLKTPQVPYAAACPACKLFGCTGTASRIRFTDAAVTDLSPSSKACSVYRDMIGIDRFSGGVSQGANMRFHALESTSFTTIVEVTNFELWQLGLLAYVLRDFAMGMVPIGFGKTKGFGMVRGEVREIRLTYTTGKANGHVQHLGSLVSTEEQKHYGFHAAAAPACALRQVPPEGLSLYETFTVEEHEPFWAVVALAFNAFVAAQEQGDTP